MIIKVMGSGCHKCSEAEHNVKAAVEDTGLKAQIIKVTDFQEIAQAGVFSTPAIVIDGQIKTVGKVPRKDEIMNWLQECSS